MKEVTITRTLNKTMVIGVAYGGKQEPKFWGPVSALTANLWKLGIEYHGVLHAGSMMVDGNRNNIVTGFLKLNLDWLLWIDTDNTFRLAAIKRLFDMNRTIATGMYVGKAPPYHNISFRRTKSGMYHPISEFEDFYKGEIIPVDMAGMGFCLTHRSVFTDMKEQFTVLQDAEGGFWPIHNDDIRGKINDDAKHVYDGKVHQGQLRTRMRTPREEPEFWPWFQMRHGKTEDVIFYENAAKAGHKPWCDTSLEAKHFGMYDYTMQDRLRVPEHTEVTRHPRNYEVTYEHDDPDRNDE